MASGAGRTTVPWHWRQSLARWCDDESVVGPTVVLACGCNNESAAGRRTVLACWRDDELAAGRTGVLARSRSLAGATMVWGAGRTTVPWHWRPSLARWRGDESAVGPWQWMRTRGKKREDQQSSPPLSSPSPRRTSCPSSATTAVKRRHLRQARSVKREPMHCAAGDRRRAAGDRWPAGRATRTSNSRIER